MGTLNAHRLLAGTKVYEGYLGALDVGQLKEQMLKDALKQVRQTLRTGFRALQKDGVALLLEAKYLAKADTLPALAPRFRMQGSMKYRTLNDPAQNPPQEIDVDDGMYLPTSFVGTAKPVIASRMYFQAVEKILDPLCRQKRWVLDRSKPCCVRVRITTEAHIDLPLYAIPDEEFVQMAEDTALLTKADSQLSDLELSDAAYKALPKDRIMLARRNDDWLESDPRKIEDWFRDAVEEHGDAVRHVSRYLKGWRDFQLERCKISSLLLMACAVETFDALRGTIAKGRDDLALFEVARNLPNQFGKPVENPIFRDQILNKDWSDEDRRKFVRLAQQLYAEVDAALNQTYNKQVAIAHFREAFGSRVPNMPDLIEIDSKEAAVLAYPRAKVPSPSVPRTTSG